ncbi:MAG: cytochrome c biogenesis protein ResB, partial [Desulfobacterales bacterium]
MSTRQSSDNPSAIDQIWKSFASVKLTIGLLLTLAATSIIGTLIPQNESPAAYLQSFGETLYRIFSLLGLLDMFHSWWFRALILLLVVNIIVCSIDRLQATWKIIFARNPRFKVARYRHLKNKTEFNHDGAAAQLNERYLPVISRRFR